MPFLLTGMCKNAILSARNQTEAKHEWFLTWHLAMWQITLQLQQLRVDIRLSHTALREMAHCTKAPVSIQEYYGPIQRHTKQLSKAIRESQNKLWWAPLNTPNPSDVVQICDKFTCGKMQEYLVYFKFLRKWRWHKDALQMAGERVFRGDLIFLIISFC